MKQRRKTKASTELYQKKKTFAKEEILKKVIKKEIINKF
jgi:hypothetical protein